MEILASFEIDKSIMKFVFLVRITPFEFELSTSEEIQVTSPLFTQILFFLTNGYKKGKHLHKSR